MRAIARRTIGAAGSICGIVLAWAASPLVSSDQSATVRIAITWPRDFTEASKTAFIKDLGKDVVAWGSSALRGSAAQNQSTRWRLRPTPGELEVEFATNSADSNLARAAVEQIVLRLPERSLPGGPSLSVAPRTWLDDFPDFPSIPLAAVGAALGLFAALMVLPAIPESSSSPKSAE